MLKCPPALTLGEAIEMSQLPCYWLSCLLQDNARHTAGYNIYSNIYGGKGGRVGCYGRTKKHNLCVKKKNYRTSTRLNEKRKKREEKCRQRECLLCCALVSRTRRTPPTVPCEYRTVFLMPATSYPLTCTSKFASGTPVLQQLYGLLPLLFFSSLPLFLHRHLSLASGSPPLLCAIAHAVHAPPRVDACMQSSCQVNAALQWRSTLCIASSHTAPFPLLPLLCSLFWFFFGQPQNHCLPTPDSSNVFPARANRPYSFAAFSVGDHVEVDGYTCEGYASRRPRPSSHTPQQPSPSTLRVYTDARSLGWFRHASVQARRLCPTLCGMHECMHAATSNGHADACLC